MSDPSLALQGALVSAVKAAATEVGTRVYDQPPRNSNGEVTAQFPYVTVGPGQMLAVDEECWDRSEFYHQIDVYSRAVGYPECKRVAGAIRDALHEQEIAVSGHTLDRMTVRSIDYNRERDGVTSRARISLQTDTQPD